MSDGHKVLETLNSLRFSRLPADEFWDAYLSNACRLCHAVLGVVMIQEEEGGWRRHGPACGQGEHTKYLANLLRHGEALAERARANGFAYEPAMPLDSAGLRKPVALAVGLITSGGDPDAMLVFLLDRAARNVHFNEYIVRLRLIADIPACHFSGEQTAITPVHSESHSLAAMKILTLILQQRKFVLACVTLVNELASRFTCSQVSIGWKKGPYVSVVAVSHVERIERTSSVIQALESVFEESMDQDAEILLPCSDPDDGTIMAMHRKYAHDKHDSALLSLPLRYRGDGVGVVTCEKSEGTFRDEELLLLRLVTSQVTPWLCNLYEHDRWIGSRLALAIKKNLSRSLGAEYTWTKLSALLLSLSLIYIFFFSWVYKVDAMAILATDRLAFLSAPFDGYIRDVAVHTGDTVAKDEILLHMDKEELYLKESEAAADVLRFTRESEKARAVGAFADMRVADARVKQAQARLSRIRYYLNRADVKSPFDGFVIQGDKKQLLGAPVSKGDLLFKVAQLGDLYVSMKVSERDIDAIREGAKAELVLLSRPGERIPIRVDRIVPMAEVEENRGNMFTVRASFVGNPKPWWRPGMSGEAKIVAGERPVFWILSHRAVEYLRMHFWW
ncbi:MAG: HlyD family efflux transporter periplasmic adaptor subunit [Gammaproteobacteria bacterium]|nr:MAG: HlyD family efflux transporter periplasmic adaptor subunit [Gammaproteobacteria bacterium]